MILSEVHPGTKEPKNKKFWNKILMILSEVIPKNKEFQINHT